MTTTDYQPAQRGLLFGIASLVVHALTTAVVAMRAQASENPALLLDQTVLQIGHLVVTTLALIGVGYCAIAHHTGRRGPLLVVAWIVVVLAVFSDVQPFFFVIY